jgi:hypothetical protein
MTFVSSFYSIILVLLPLFGNVYAVTVPAVAPSVPTGRKPVNPTPLPNAAQNIGTVPSLNLQTTSLSFIGSSGLPSISVKAVATSAGSGDGSSTEFASGGLIEIPKGKKISLPATGNITASNITVRGVLTCENVQSLDLTVNAIRIVDGGEFRCDITEKSKLKMTFTGDFKSIEVDGGFLHLGGAPRFSWTRIAATIEPGASKFTV